MPRIPRRSQDADGAPANEEQRTDHPTQGLSSGDPLGGAPSGSASPAPAGATSGDPLRSSAPQAQPASEPPTTAAPPETSTSAESGTDAPAPAPSDGVHSAAPPADAPPATGGSVESTSGASSEAAVEQPTVAAPPVEQPTAVVPAATGAPLAQPQATAETSEVAAEQAPADARPRFRQRTRMRRRLRYLRRLRELAFRDLGGLVFDLHRFGRDRQDLVTAKLEALAGIDRELRSLQDALRDRRDFTDLREAGIAACPRCGTLHDTDANFCPGCGTSLRTAIVRDAAPVTVTPADDPQQPTPTGS